jgi:hypothetical protein
MRDDPALTTDPHDDDAPETVAIRYRGQGGALVLVAETATPRRPDHPHDRYYARCTGCLDHLDGLLPADLHRARDWADKHAAACRALPQPDDTREADRA